MEIKNEERKPIANAMAFYHKDGLPAAWQQAAKFAGENGRLATMPDIVSARLATKPGEVPWKKYFTTLTAEYYGFTKSGKLILIVAHGIGPMANLDGILRAYSWEFKDKNRQRSGGRITDREFWKLESGKYGEVSVVEYKDYCERYEYPFMQVLRLPEAMEDPVLKARLGVRVEEYVFAHAQQARKWHREQAEIFPENTYGIPEDIHREFLGRRRAQHYYDSLEGIPGPYIITVKDAVNCSYFGHHPRIPEPGYAIAHLISIGGLCRLHHQDGESLTCDVSCHEWWNGVRLVGISGGVNSPEGIHPGFDSYKLLRRHWRELLEPVFLPDVESPGFRALVKIGDQWFTQYPKQGQSMDSWEPEYAVASIEEIGRPTLFRTKICGYHGIFAYGIKEVEAIAPQNANAYYLAGDPAIELDEDGDPTHHIVIIQFCRIQADTTKRLIRNDQLCHNYDRMMSLLEKEDGAV